MKSSREDPRESFLARIKFSDVRVKPFNGFLFLCGGVQDTRNFTPLQSVRHLIYREIVSGHYTDLAQKLKLAEDIQDWFRDGKYSDLVTFEEHLACLSSVILLIVESPGSIAELGAFSVTRTISSRLITIVDEHHYQEDSFIRLGPINRLERETQRPVLVHDWHESDFTGHRSAAYEKILPEVSQILEDVRHLLRNGQHEQVFRSGDAGHSMILIGELCDLFGALSQQEIERYVVRSDPGMDSNLVDQYLFLMEKCGILKIKPKGHGRYYYAPDWDSRITFAFLDGNRVERDRVRTDVMEYYKRNLRSRAEVVRILRKAA